MREHNRAIGSRGCEVFLEPDIGLSGPFGNKLEPRRQSRVLHHFLTQQYIWLKLRAETAAVEASQFDMAGSRVQRGPQKGIAVVENLVLLVFTRTELQTLC